MAATVVHGEVYDADGVAVSARSVAPGGSGSGRCTCIHCSALAEPAVPKPAAWRAVPPRPSLPFSSAGGVTDHVTVLVAPGATVAKLAGDVAATVQPCGACAVSFTLRSSVRPLLVMVPVAVVAVPAVSVGWVCWPGTVLATCTPTEGRAALANWIITDLRPGLSMTVCVAAS